MSADTPSAASEVAPTRLGRYEILRRLAVGGMAEIYLARATGIEDFSKLVVCKRILPHLAADEGFVRMFLDEARLAATLQHPNIVQVFDIGQEEGGGALFFAMEYVPGRDLQQVLSRARARGVAIELDAALAIALALCAGLHHAHEACDERGRSLGIVHRDVSPSNVIVTPEGGVKLVDFGIAKAATQTSITREAFVKGKVSYMSPEQCTGGGVDRRSDVFALGILLWELTTGRRLYAAESDYAILHLVADRDAPAPSSVVPGYPPALEAVVLRALRRDPDQRYASARDLQIDLENVARSLGLHASPLEVARLVQDLFGAELADDRTRARGDEEAASARRGSAPRRRREPRASLLGGLALLAAGAGLGTAAALGFAGRDSAATYQEYHDRDRRARRQAWIASAAFLMGGTLVVPRRRRDPRT